MRRAVGEAIFGRSDEKNQGLERMEIIQEREKETGFHILTYDSLVDAYARVPRTKKNILKVAGKRYSFKKLVDPGQAFRFMKPTELTLTTGQVEWLRGQGYEIDAWRNEGKLLDGDLLSKTVAKDIKETVADMIETLRAKANKG